MRKMLKSKIHRAQITETDLHYEGSITIDAGLMKAADILPHEIVSIYNINNGARFQTYAIEGERGSGCIGINGAAARLAQAGDLIIILSFRTLSENDARETTPILIKLNDNNQIVAP